MDVDKAVQTQLDNIQKKTGKSLDEIFGLLGGSGLAKHGELRDWLKTELSLGHGDANTVVHFYLRKDEEAVADPLDEIYTGPKAGLRPIHDAFLKELATLGAFETAPKKGYISYRCSKQFAMLGPATNSRVELGLNMKGVAGTDRLLDQPGGGMCQYKVKLTSPDEIDAELMAWVKIAYESAS